MPPIDCLPATSVLPRNPIHARGATIGGWRRLAGRVGLAALFVSGGAQAAAAKQAVQTSTAGEVPAAVALTTPPSGFVLPPELAKNFPVDSVSCFMGPEDLTINTTQWKAYACSDYRSLILTQSWANGETYVFTLTTKGIDVLLNGAGQAPADVVAKAQQSLKSLKVGGLVDMTADVVAAWRARAPGR